MLLNVTEENSILKEIQEIQSYLEIEVDSGNLNNLIEYGEKVTVYLARTSKLLADAKYHQNVAKKAVMNSNINKGYSPSVLKELVNASIESENYLVDWIERLNRACTHRVDWIRSVLSKEKEEMRLTMTGFGQK